MAQKTTNIANQWDNDYWDEVIFNINEGNCILMLGPNASLEKNSGGPKPQWKPSGELLSAELASQSVVKDAIKKWNINTENLFEVALVYTLIAQAGKSKLLQKVKSFYGERSEKSLEVYENIAALPFPLVISTTPDDMCRNAFAAAGKIPFVEFYNYKGDETDVTCDYNTETPLLYKLYGDIQETRSLVLTDDDVLDFLVAITDKNPPIPSEILTELRSNEKTILFLGFGFENWYLRILFRILEIENKESPSYALENIKPSSLNSLHNTVIYYSQSKFKIRVCNYDILKFTRELKTRFQKEYPDAITAGHAPAGDAKTVKKNAKEITSNVFISYAREDEAIAKKIHDELKKAGCSPWWDKENLRGGDDWDDMIESKLKNSDYMVIIISDHLHEKVSSKSYVVKEIKKAMEGKQSQTLPPEKFIIPAIVNKARRLDALKEIQAVDIADGKNVTALIKVIQDDFKRRRNAV